MNKIEDMQLQDDKEWMDMFRPMVFAYLNKISKGTNKPFVKGALTPKGITYVFDLPIEVSEILFNEWKQKYNATTR